VGTDDTVIRIWDAVSGSPLAALPGNEYRVESLGFTPNGDRVLSAHRLGPVVRVWDAFGEPGRRTLIGHRSMIYSVCFSAGDKFLASGSLDGTVRLWDTQSGRTAHVLSGHRGGAKAIACSPNGPYLASGSADPAIRIWDVDRGEAIRSLRGHDAAITALAYSHDGTRIASASMDKTIRIWDFATGRLVRTLRVAEAAGSIDFSRDGRHLVSGSGNGAPVFQVWDLATGEPAIAMQVRLPREQTRSSTGPKPARVAYSPDGSFIAGGSFGPPVNIWDPVTGRTVGSLATRPAALPPSLFLGSLSWSPGGTRLAISWNNDIQIWDARFSELLTVLESPYKSNRMSLAFDHRGILLASGSEDGTVKLWDSRSSDGASEAGNRVGPGR
jgi:WD40 repeat protein